MRRVMAFAVISLGLGVVTTYGVAWGLMNAPAARRSPSGYASPLGTASSTVPFGVVWMISDATQDDGGVIRADTSVAYGDVGRGESWCVAFKRRQTTQSWLAMAEIPRSGKLVERAGGWPRLAVAECMFVEFGRVPKGVEGFDVTLRRSNHANPWSRLSLALRPLWPGFTIDVAVYGTAWAAALAGFRAVRRVRRVAAGLCPSCRYDLGGLAGRVCPECGMKV